MLMPWTPYTSDAPLLTSQGILVDYAQFSLSSSRETKKGKHYDLLLFVTEGLLAAARRFFFASGLRK
jgi:hypothetical protein